MDLVIQAHELSSAAVEAFRVALPAARLQRHVNAARLFDLEQDAQTAAVARALAHYWKCDATLLPRRLRAGDFRVLAMDMDSTVITIECIDELARLAGRGAEVAAITEAAMRGEITDYAQSLRRRVALLAGTEAGVLERVRSERLRFSPGAAQLVRGAHEKGWKTLLVSGGFSVFAEFVGSELGFDETCANRLHIGDDGRLAGTVGGPPENGGKIVDAGGKARALERLCARLHCSADAAIAVGDGANDLEMMGLAGLSVAYRAKPRVRQAADAALDYTGLDGVLELLSDPW